MHAIKKIVKKLLNIKPSPEQSFLAFYYQRHNQRRLEHLASLGLDIRGSSVLEVGAGVGDHTSFFIDRDCRVTSSDGREENLEVLRSRYPNIRVFHLDLDSLPETFNDQFDIIYCYGLLYHLKHPDRAIEFMSRCCNKMLLLETCVSFGDEDAVNLCPEDELIPTQALSGTGCRPTRRWVHDQLKKYFDFVYLPTTQPNHEEFPADWTVSPPEKLLSRAVFIASRQKLDNELLIEEIPLKQRRAP